jgi:DNA-binding MarR family transcriptional regulator
MADDAQELVKVTGRFSHAYMRWLRARMEQTGGRNPTQVHLLHVLHCQGPQKMIDLVQHLGVTARNVTKLVDALEAEGLVCREDVPDDRRAVLVQLSDAGRQRQREWASEGLEVGAALFRAHLSAAEQGELLRLLRRLLGGLEQTCEGAVTPPTCPPSPTPSEP